MACIMVYHNERNGEYAFYGPFASPHLAEEWVEHSPDAPMVDPFTVLASDDDEPPGCLFTERWIGALQIVMPHT